MIGAPNAAEDPNAAQVANGTVLLPAVRFATAERGRQGVILRIKGVAPP